MQFKCCSYFFSTVSIAAFHFLTSWLIVHPVYSHIFIKGFCVFSFFFPSFFNFYIFNILPGLFHLFHTSIISYIPAADPDLSKRTYKDSNYQRYIEACSAAQAWDLWKITQQ